MKTVCSLRLGANLLVPVWIIAFGLISLLEPARGPVGGLWALLVGGVVVPALIMIPFALGSPEPAGAEGDERPAVGPAEPERLDESSLLEPLARLRGPRPWKANPQSTPS